MLNEHRRAEGHVRVDVIGRGEAQVDGLQVGLDAAVTADPVAVVFGLEAERGGQRDAEVGLFADRHVEISSRDRRDHAGVAAVTARDRGAGAGTGRAGVAAAALEIGREADGAQVTLDLHAFQLAHAGRVDGDDRGVALGAARTGEGAAKTLGAVFLQLEGGGVDVAGGQGTGDADGQGGDAGKRGSGMHVWFSPELR